MKKPGFHLATILTLKKSSKQQNCPNQLLDRIKIEKINLKEYNDFKKLYISESPLTSISDREKVDFLREIDNYIKKKDKRVQQVIINLSSSHDSIFVANSLGKYCFDDRPLVRFNVMVILKSNDRVERGSAGGGGRYSYSTILGTNKPFELADEAIRIANVNLDSIPCKAGNTTVVLGSGWPGVASS